MIEFSKTQFLENSKLTNTPTAPKSQKFKEIVQSSWAMTSISENSENSNLAVVAVKTRLQDFRVIFGFKAAALAVEHRSDSV